MIEQLVLGTRILSPLMKPQSPLVIGGSSHMRWLDLELEICKENLILRFHRACYFNSIQGSDVS